MAIVLDRRGRQLATLTAAMLVLLVAGELHHHLSVRTVVLPRLFFELAELVLLLGCMVAGTLLIFRVRVRKAATAIAGMVALLLIGHWYIGDRPAAPWTLLFELIKLLFLLGCTVTCTLLTWQVEAPRDGHSR
jgi:hypothetical protein